ncbi:MAG TPA: hypothetical protein VEG33_07210, partial [Streptosporangiaceae bacterium]|nr:hypothetical protein [Streptosporangiaceae bacterium]
MLTNSGTLNVGGGTLTANSFPTNAGVLSVASGATLSMNGTLVNTGTVSGRGTINVGAGNAVVNQGVLAAGTSPGTLSITGDLVLDGAAGSVTNVEIAGLTPGAQYDVINVTGQVRGTGPTQEDWGALVVTHPGAFTPAAGNAFTILNYGSRLANGDFKTKTYPVSFFYNASANANDYQLSLASASADVWKALTGNWETPSNWSLNRAPLASDDVIIPDVGAPGVSDTITVNASGQVAKSIINAESLQVLSGDLRFTASSANTGTLQITGGTLTADGNLTGGAINLSSGALAGAGNVTAASLNWAGGTIQGSGTLAAGNLGITGGGARSLSGRTLRNTGAGLIDGTSLGLSGGAALVNDAGATFTFQGASFDINGGTFSNLGTINRTGSGATQLNAGSPAAVFDNSGQVNVMDTAVFAQNGGSGTHSGSFDVAPGALLQFGGGAGAAYSFTGPTSITGSGQVNFSSTSTVGGSLSAGVVEVCCSTSVTIKGPYAAGITRTAVGSGPGGPIDFDGPGATTGTLVMSGGSVGGAAGLTVTGSWSYTPGASIETVLTLGSAVNSTLSGTVTGSASGSISNQGTVTLTSSATLLVPVTNTGTLTVSGGTLAKQVTNSGQIDFGGTSTVTSGGGVSGGIVNFSGGTTTFESGSGYGAGSTNVSGGAIASFGNLATTGALRLSDGTLAGSGSLTVTGGWSYTMGSIDTTLVLSS